MWSDKTLSGQMMKDMQEMSKKYPDMKEWYEKKIEAGKNFTSEIKVDLIVAIFKRRVHSK